MISSSHISKKGKTNDIYAKAFARNLGCVTDEEAARLKRTCVAIPGLGGVGGAHVEVLARQGIGRFKIADFDTFEISNFNRQFGATMNTIGQFKTKVLSKRILSINPEAEVDIYRDGISVGNIDAFLTGVDVVVDSLDAFSIEVRRLLYRKAYARAIPVVAAGPLGFGTAVQIFMPGQMSFDAYFGFTDSMPEKEKLLRYFLGIAPKGFHLSYLDSAYVNFKEKRGPSSSVGVTLCAALAATEVLRIVLEWGDVRAVPYSSQFDARKGRWVQQKLWGGAARSPLQTLKRMIVRHKLKNLF